DEDDQRTMYRRMIYRIVKEALVSVNTQQGEDRYSIPYVDLLPTFASLNVSRKSFLITGITSSNFIVKTIVCWVIDPELPDTVTVTGQDPLGGDDWHIHDGVDVKYMEDSVFLSVQYDELRNNVGKMVRVPF